MSHREPEPKEFESKTIKKVDLSCINVWKFWFTDGTAIALEIESYGPAGYGLVACDECVGVEPKESLGPDSDPDYEFSKDPYAEEEHKCR